MFVEHSDNVTIDSFTISLLAAVPLQALLKLTMTVERRVGLFFTARPGALMKFLRFFCAWLILFSSKFVILKALSLAFGDKVKFDGAFHGLLMLVIIIVTMLLAEEAFVRVYAKLADRQ